MNVHRQFLRLLPATALLLVACENRAPESADTPQAPPVAETANPRFDIYAPFTLTADLSGLSESQRKMIPLLIQASEVMDELFWRQAFGENHEQWLATIEDEKARKFARINYGPWDRMDNEKPFIDGAGEKPLGAAFYPADMTREEFAAADLENKIDLYSLIRRDGDGGLIRVPYHEAYANELARAADLLLQAAALAEDEGFRTYLELRADALLTDEFQASDLAWMDAKTNPIDVVIGPIENYEDRLFGYRAAYEAYVLIKDKEWSKRLAKFAAFLPELQRGLPVDDAYKAEEPGTDSDLNAYDVIYYAGDSNAGSKTIAINLPNDEQVQLQKGTRRLQLKNAMQAKFEKILEPIANVLIDESQRQHVTFDAFFGNVMFHEVAHGLGVKQTINGKGTVRNALLDTATSLEECKADVLGLYMITRLNEAGELGDEDLKDNYVTFLADIFRATRFGASSAHGKANMISFNYFAELGAFQRDPATGKYKVDFERMQEAMNGLSALLLRLQGDGDYKGATQLLDSRGTISPELQTDLDRLTEADIAVDIIFRQGVEVLGLE